MSFSLNNIFYYFATENSANLLRVKRSQLCEIFVQFEGQTSKDRGRPAENVDIENSTRRPQIGKMLKKKKKKKIEELCATGRVQLSRVLVFATVAWLDESFEVVIKTEHGFQPPIQTIICERQRQLTFKIGQFIN